MNKQLTDEKRRAFLKKAGKVAVAAPSVMFLVSAMNPQAALGYSPPQKSESSNSMSPSGDEWTKPEYGRAIEVFKGPDGEYDSSDDNGNNYYDRGTNVHDNTEISNSDNTATSIQDSKENNGNRNSSRLPGGYVSVGHSGNSGSGSHSGNSGSDPVSGLAVGGNNIDPASGAMAGGDHRTGVHNSSGGSGHKGGSGGSNGGDTASVNADKNIFIRPHQEKGVLL